MQPKFNVGDKVICLDIGYTGLLHKDVVYTVHGFSDVDTITLTEANPGETWWDTRRFKRHKISNEERVALRMAELQT